MGVNLSIDEVIDILPQSTRRDAIPIHSQILACLNFLSGGSYQRKVGGDFLACMSQTSVSRFIHRVIEALNAIMSKWIVFPTTVEEIERIQNGVNSSTDFILTTVISGSFWEKWGFPGVIGLIDGTHVSIVTPAGDREAHFINRKHSHSINVQVVCDDKLRILSINASHGGRTHDSRVFFSSKLSAHLREQYEAGRRDCWLLEHRYTMCHARTRSTIERCFAALKGVWRCLLKDRVLHYEPEFAALICNACAVLHNMVIKWKIPVFESLDSLPSRNDVAEEDDDEEVEPLPDIPVRIGEQVRAELIAEYFTG